MAERTPERWDGDENLEGVASGKVFMPHVERLARLLDEDKWIAEDPDIHLRPHIYRAVEKIRSLELVRAVEIPRGIYEVKLRWEPTDATAGDLRSEIFSVIGTFAEATTQVEQRIVDDEIHFEVATGMPDEETPFKTHGHLVRLRITGEAAVDAAQNHRDFMETGTVEAAPSAPEDAEEGATPS